ncbi:MAG: DUF3440 domain-containing protein [Selenomonadaceae bacterium]|nr:DUF3440 domain-containing protein [Selenomonadaceae bacterium]
MGKIYQNYNVYEALQKRLKYIFSEFENVIIAFSGGKDSGLLLNATMEYINTNGVNNMPVLFHQDFEAQYKWTTKYVTEMFEKYKDRVKPFWFCQPMAVRTALGNYEMYWYPWDDQKSDIWIRNIPELPYVYTINNNPFELYRYGMDYHSHANQFAKWYKLTHGNKPTITLLGLRAQESLNRYSAIVNKRKPYKNNKWITSELKDTYTASPIYDWTTEDIWIANAKFNYPYNHLYDLFYKAGVSINDMRVASPFSDDAKASLNLYRVLEPETWAKLVGRVQGVNFAVIYGRTKAMGYRDITLPKGYTWKSYTKFLLSTLPKNIRDNYIEKFCTSIRFWHKIGGGFPKNIVDEIKEAGYDIEINGISNYTKDKKDKIIFHGKIPDNTDDVLGTKDIPSWKRMCLCILKNDHTCRTMGFGLTKKQQERIKIIKEKYAHL